MRPRPRTPLDIKILERVMISSAGSSTTTAGALASMTWLRGNGLTPPLHDRWRVEILLDAVEDRSAVEPDDMNGTRFRIEIDREEWGFAFCHDGQASWIRVTSVPFIHVCDDHRLLARTPPLKQIGRLVQSLERDYKIRLHRESAHVRSTLPGLDQVARDWLSTF